MVLPRQKDHPQNRDCLHGTNLETKKQPGGSEKHGGGKDRSGKEKMNKRKGISVRGQRAGRADGNNT